MDTQIPPPRPPSQNVGVTTPRSPELTPMLHKLRGTHHHVIAHPDHGLTVVLFVAPFASVLLLFSCIVMPYWLDAFDSVFDIL